MPYIIVVKNKKLASRGYLCLVVLDLHEYFI